MTKKDQWITGIRTAPHIQKYSQTCEEGVLKYLLDSIGSKSGLVVDIGAWDGTFLSNTKYFEELGYTRLLIDGKDHNVPEVHQHWVTKENVVDILTQHDCPKEFEMLSYDTDGNDYDILLELLTHFKPKVVVAEINGTIPRGVSKKIKYNPDHIWNSDDYYGFSFDAAFVLARETGYKIVHENSALNIYMVRQDLLDDPNISIDVPFHHSQYHRHTPSGVWETVS